MKKVVKLVLFFFGVLAICGGVVSAVNPTEGFFPTKHVDAQVHAISANADRGIVVNVRETASSGDVVSVSLEFDENELVVESVSVNSGRAVRLSAKEFEFVMPNEDVVLTVNSSAVEPEVSEFAVHNLAADKGVVLVGLPSQSVAGETLSFKVQFAPDSGYTFTDKVEVYTLVDGERGVDVQVSLMAGAYSFTMPESDVAVSIGTESKLFALSKSENNKDNLGSIETWDGEKFISTSASSTYALYNTPVRVHLKTTTVANPVGLKVNGELLLPAEETDYVEFLMPNRATVIEVEVERLYRPITVTNSEHVTLTLCELVDGEYVPLAENKATPTYDVYIKAVSSDPEHYAPGTPNVMNGSSSISVSLVSQNDEYSIFKFIMKDADGIQVIANEIAMAYKGYGFSGVYYGANIYETSMSTTYAQKSGKTLGSSYSFSNSGGDTLAFKGTPKSINSVEGSKDAGFIKFGGTNGMAYGKKWAYGYYSGAMSSLDKPDAMVAYEIPSGSASDYEFKYLAVKLSTSTDKWADYYLVEVWNVRSNSLIDCAVLNYDCNIKGGELAPMYAYLNDITFELNEGSSSVSDSAFSSCVVKQNGEAVFNVTKGLNENNTIVATIEKVN